VNFSNSGSAVANVAQAAAPGILGQIVGGARWAARAAGNNAAVGKAMRADVPGAASGSPRKSQRLNELLLLGSAGAAWQRRGGGCRRALGSVLLPAALLSFLLLIPVRVVVERVAGQDAIQSVHHDTKNEDDRQTNENMLPVHGLACEVEK